jgi:hypothetical protein
MSIHKSSGWCDLTESIVSLCGLKNKTTTPHRCLVTCERCIAIELKPEDRVRYYSVKGVDNFSEHKVIAVYPDGIPSCREPMVKLEGKSGLILVSNCNVMGTN